MKKCTSSLLIAALIFTAIILTSCQPSAPQRKRSNADIIKEMVSGYGKTQNSKAVQANLEELTEQDLAEGTRWTQIMDFWKYANDEMVLNYAVPEDLDDSRALCFAVLGFQLNPDGTMKDELIGRLQTALTCAEAYPNAYILCTGGGTAEKNRNATEAGMMAQWLEDNGIPSQRIIVENTSLTTTQNVQFSYNIILDEYPIIQHIVVVSSDYHIPWGIVLWETQFLLADSDADRDPIHVVSNVAYEAKETHTYPIPYYQAAGILDIAGL